MQFLYMLTKDQPFTFQQSIEGENVFYGVNVQQVGRMQVVSSM